MPSVFESAAFSLHVYRDKDQPELPPGWSLFMDCPLQYQTDGYFGSVYSQCMDADLGLYDVVIAHRGTLISDIPDLVEDLEMFISQKVPAQFLASVLPFVVDVTALLDQQYGVGQYTISFTGHSLGAVLAELSVAKWGSELFSDGTTFESPGSKPLILKLIQQNVLPSEALDYASTAITIFNADVNGINSCMEHISSPGFPNYVGYSYRKDVLAEYPIPPDQEYFFIDFSCNDQHSMVKMYDYLKNTASFLKPKLKDDSFVWPIGFSNAFDYYMTYLPINPDGGAPEVEHCNYWDGYIQKCWDESALIRWQYKNDLSAFSADFIKKNLKQDPSSFLALSALSFEYSKTKIFLGLKPKTWFYVIQSLMGILILLGLGLALPLGIFQMLYLQSMGAGHSSFQSIFVQSIFVRNFLCLSFWILGFLGLPLMYLYSWVRGLQHLRNRQYHTMILFSLLPFLPFILILVLTWIAS